MQLNIDTKPKLYKLKFSTLETDYTQTTSPRSIIKQSGLEFDHFREYQPSDDANLIDWVASARSNQILTRVYTQNTSLNILIMLDASESMIYGTVKKAKIEYAIELVLNAIFGILNYGDSAALMVYSDRILHSTPFNIGIDSYHEFAHTLTHGHESFGRDVNFSRAVNFAIERYKETHLLILVSDFLGYEDSLFEGISSVSDRFDILGIMVYDKSDVELSCSSRFMKVIDPFSTDRRFVNTKKLTKTYSKYNKERISRLEAFFSALNKDFWKLSTEQEIEMELPKLLMIREGKG